EAVDQHRALGNGVDVAVSGKQGGHQQGAALQAVAITERGNRDIHAGALGAKGRQIGGDHDGGNIGGADVFAGGVDAEPFEHGLQGLLGEGGVVEAVAGAVEANHQAVADQLVVA